MMGQSERWVLVGYEHWRRVEDVPGLEAAWDAYAASVIERTIGASVQLTPRGRSA